MPEEVAPALRLVIEVPADGLRDLVALLAPLKHVAYRSDLWFTERGEADRGRSASDNGATGEGAREREREVG